MPRPRDRTFYAVGFAETRVLRSHERPQCWTVDAIRSLNARFNVEFKHKSEMKWRGYFDFVLYFERDEILQSQRGSPASLDA